MSRPGRVEGDETLRLFLALRLPDDALDRFAAWTAAALAGGGRAGAGRPAAREHLHITLAFLGSRPARELSGIVAELRAAAANVPAEELAPVGYRETRSVGMIVLEDATGAARALAADLHHRLERLGAYTRVAPARHRPAVPRAAAAAAAARRAGAVRAVRRRCFPFTSAPVRRPVRGARIGPPERLEATAPPRGMERMR